MDEEVRQLFTLFLQSSHEYLDALNTDLVQFEAGDVTTARLQRLQRTLHTLKGSCSMFGLAGGSQVAHALEDLVALLAADQPVPPHVLESCFTGVDILTRTLAACATDPQEPAATAEQAAAFATEAREAAAALAQAAPEAGGEAIRNALTTLTVEAEDLREALGDFHDFTPFLQALAVLGRSVEESAASPAAAGRAPEPTAPGPAPDTAPPAESERVVRVEEGRIDSFLEHVGGLIEIAEVTKYLHRQLQTQGLNAERLREFQQVALQLREHAFALQHALMDIRRVNLRGVYDALPRLVRDVAHHQEKEVDLVLDGAEATVDKSLLDQVEACLVQLLRNAVAHGIEPPAARQLAGKDPRGRIEVAAANADQHLVLTVRDDGAGLDLAKIRRRAIEAGLVSAERAERLSDPELQLLVFSSGLSTAEAVGLDSGRGVGLDVVAAEAKQLGGHVEIQSAPGAGTAVVVRLPTDVTLSVLSGIVAQTGPTRFVVPVTAVQESVYPDADAITAVEGRGEALLLREHLYPLWRSSALFDVAGCEAPDATGGVAMVVEAAGQQAAILFDHLVDLQQVVLKHIEGLPLVEGLAGGAILSDGGIGLVIDPEQLFLRAGGA